MDSKHEAAAAYVDAANAYKKKPDSQRNSLFMIAVSLHFLVLNRQSVERYIILVSYIRS